MKIIGFDDRYKGFNIWDVAQLTLDKDEVARICCIDPEQELAVAHWVTFAENDKRNGYYRCLGRYEVIYGALGSGQVGQGVDAEMCPFCAVQVKNGAVNTVTRRYATNVIKYVADVKGNIRQPLAADCIVWRFSDDKYNRLADIRKQYGHPQYGLQVIDLQVKCEVKQYQRFAIDPLRNCLWQEAGGVVSQQILEMWKANRQANLTDLLGTLVDSATAGKYVSEAMGTPMRGGVVPVMQPPDPAQLQRLLDESMPAPARDPMPTAALHVAPPQVSKPSELPLPVFVGDAARTVPAAQPTVIGPPPATQSAPAPKVPPITDFNDLLKV